MVTGRWRNHLMLSGVSVLVFLVAQFGSPAESAADHLSIATAWLCAGLVAAALLLGPYLRIKSDRQIVNHYVRRDIGLWSALTALIHFVVAVDVSMSPTYMSVYVHITDTALSLEWRDRLFSWGSMLGTVAGLLLMVLAAISNDKLLVKLGQKNWKKIQGLAYPAFLLTMLHGLAFQLLESRTSMLIALLVVLTLVVIWVRLASRVRNKAKSE